MDKVIIHFKNVDKLPRDFHNILKVVKGINGQVLVYTMDSPNTARYFVMKEVEKIEWIF